MSQGSESESSLYRARCTIIRQKIVTLKERKADLLQRIAVKEAQLQCIITSWPKGEVRAQSTNSRASRAPGSLEVVEEVEQTHSPVSATLNRSTSFVQASPHSHKKGAQEMLSHLERCRSTKVAVASCCGVPLFSDVLHEMLLKTHEASPRVRRPFAELTNVRSAMSTSPDVVSPVPFETDRKATRASNKRHRSVSFLAPELDPAPTVLLE